MEQKVIEIINIIRKNKNLAPLEQYGKDSKLREDCGLTSFDLAELTVRIEDEYDIDIFEDGLVNTIGEVLSKLENK